VIIGGDVGDQKIFSNVSITVKFLNCQYYGYFVW